MSYARIGSVKDRLLGLLIFAVCALVFCVIGWLPYAGTGVLLYFPFTWLHLGRWRSGDREDDCLEDKKAAAWSAMFWPALILFSYWAIKQKESERRKRIVREVMES